MVVLQNNEETTLRLEGLQISAEPSETGLSKYDLTFNFVQTAEGLGIGIEYNTDLFAEDRITRMLGHFAELTASMLASPGCNIGELNLLPPAERAILHAFNDTAVPYPQQETIVSLFEQQVTRTPDNIALVFEDRTLTYSELNTVANGVAHYLLDHYDPQPDDIIVVGRQQHADACARGHHQRVDRRLGR